MNRSEIFQMYNRAKSGKALQTLDKARVNRALGYLLSNDQSWRDKYTPTIKECKCPDHKLNRVTCKHMIARMIEAKWVLIHKQPQLSQYQQDKIYMTMGDGDLMVAEKVGGGNYNLHLFPTEDAFDRWNRLWTHGVLVRPSRLGYGKKKFEFTHDYDGAQI